MLSQQYHALTRKKDKNEFINFVIDKKIVKMHRKSLIRALKTIKNHEITAKIRGRKRTYNDWEVYHLKQLLCLTGFLCGKLLKPALIDGLPHYACSDEIKKKLYSMSPATMDRLLGPYRADLRRQFNSHTKGTKSHIRQRIPIRDPFFRVDKPGFIETDTVCHCGDHIWGVFANSVTATDLFSGWTEARSVLGKNALMVVSSLQEMEKVLPFPLLALYFDNGMEYVNHLLVDIFTQSCATPISIARGRSGKKNDQCHVEQKNNVFIRKILGHDRIESQKVVDLINDLYKNEWSLLYNYFIPQMKLIEKDKIGSKTRRKYDKPKTPYQRIIESNYISEEIKTRLKEKKKTLNPFDLQKRVQNKINVIMKLIKQSEINRETGS
jgi:hypothetical protein